jgi:methionine synthase II (cobalamin-independent)
VARGGVPTASGLSRLPAVDASVLTQRLAAVLGAAGHYTVVHCCATAIPFGVIRAAGADAVAFDLGLLRSGEEDSLAEVADAGLGVLAGAITGSPQVPPRHTAERVVRFWRRLGMPAARCGEQVVVTPACGLAAESHAAARDALAHCRQAGRIVPELAAESKGAAR